MLAFDACLCTRGIELVTTNQQNPIDRLLPNLTPSNCSLTWLVPYMGFGCIFVCLCDRACDHQLPWSQLFTGEVDTVLSCSLGFHSGHILPEPNFTSFKWLSPGARAKQFWQNATCQTWHLSQRMSTLCSADPQCMLLKELQTINCKPIDWACFFEFIALREGMCTLQPSMDQMCEGEALQVEALLWYENLTQGVGEHYRGMRIML